MCRTVDVVRASLPLYPNRPVCRDGQVGWIILVDAVLICNKLLEQVDWNNWKRGINIYRRGLRIGFILISFNIKTLTLFMSVIKNGWGGTPLHLTMARSSVLGSDVSKILHQSLNAGH